MNERMVLFKFMYGVRERIFKFLRLYKFVSMLVSIMKHEVFYAAFMMEYILIFTFSRKNFLFFFFNRKSFVVIAFGFNLAIRCRDYFLNLNSFIQRVQNSYEQKCICKRMRSSNSKNMKGIVLDFSKVL